MHMSNCVPNSPDIFSGDIISGDITDVIMKSAAQPTLEALVNVQCDEIYAMNLQQCNITLFFVWAIFVIIYLKDLKDM